MQITRMFVPKYKYDIKCPYEMQPEFIIVHNTENDASAMAEISYMIGNNNKVSFHCAIDNTRIVQGIPFNRNSWNAGDGKNGDGNRKGISIEGATIYVTLEPCSECSKNLIASGIVRIVYEKAYEHTNSEIISKFLEDNGVKIEQIPAIS